MSNLPAYATLNHTSVSGEAPAKVLEWVERLDASGATQIDVRSYYRDMARVWDTSDQDQYVKWLITASLPKWWPVSPETRPTERERWRAEFRFDPGKDKMFTTWSAPAKKAKDGSFYFPCGRCGGHQPVAEVLGRMDRDRRQFYWSHPGDVCPDGSTYMHRATPIRERAQRR